jgi:hypothetical protein
MLEISIAIVVVALIAAFLVNKHMDMHKPEINTTQTELPHYQNQIDILRKEFNEFKLSMMINKR